PLARDRLDLRRIRLEHVELEAPAARFAEDTLQDVRLAATPELHGDAVAALEVLGEPQLVFLREGRVEQELAFLAGRRGEALGAIRAAVSGDGRHAGGWLDAGSVERARERQDRQCAARDAHL